MSRSHAGCKIAGLYDNVVGAWSSGITRLAMRIAISLRLPHRRFGAGPPRPKTARRGEQSHSPRGCKLNTESYRQKLLAEEHSLLARIGRAEESGRVAEPGARDWADEASVDEQQGEQLTEADTDSALLTQVQDALKRIDNGTFGKCLVDGGPIEEKRLEAEPWTPYCLKHQQSIEASESIRTPSL